jgi:F-type H+-transporting ATPase subunit a
MALTLVCRYFLHKKDSVVRFCLLEAISALMTMCKQTLDHFSYHHFSFIASLFIFIFACNAMSIIPYVEEPTVDLNTALALGIISFLYREYYTIKTAGILTYIKSYFQPIFIMMPLNIVGKLSSILSISFRLFGNILGGSVISNIYTSTVSSSIIGAMINFTGMSLVIAGFFGLFEGFVQAFIFSVLTLTSIGIATNKDGGGH